MKHDKKSKWKMAWNLLNQPAQGEKDSELLIYILAIIPMILIITYWHLYREPFFYIGFLTMFGWVYLWRKSDKLKPNFSSKLVNKLATFGLYFLVYFILGLGGWCFFSYILGMRLGGGYFIKVAGGAFFSPLAA